MDAKGYDVGTRLYVNKSIGCADDVESTITSSSRGNNNEIAMEMKREAREDNICATKAKALGICYAIGTVVGYSTKLIKGVTFILLNHVDEDVNKEVMILS